MNFDIKDLKIRSISSASTSELEDILTLYKKEDWWEGNDSPKLILDIIKGSIIFVCAFFDNRIIGMGRAIGDGVSDAYIQDVAIVKEFRNKKIGSIIIENIISQLKEKRIGWIGLISEKNSRDFYTKLGFSTMKGACPMKYKF